MEYGIGMALCEVIYIPSLMKTDIYVQAILRVCFRISEGVMLVLVMGVL
jgi:hypothetical protein